MWVTIFRDFDTGTLYTRHPAFSDALKRGNSLALEFMDMRIGSPRKKDFYWISHSKKTFIFIEQYLCSKDLDKILYFYRYIFPKQVSTLIKY